MRSSFLFTLTGCLAILAGQPAAVSAQALRRTLGADTSSWMAVSGQLRLRGESWNGFAAGAPAGADHDDAYGLARLLVRGELHVRSAVTVVGELKSSLAGDRTLPGGRRPSDEDVFDLQQLYVEVAASPGHTRLAARAGRFDLALGRERLVSPLDWTNSRRAFQGASARWRSGDAEVHVFWVRPLTVRSEQPNRPDTARQLYGAQLAHRWSGARAELYWLRTETRSAAFNGTAGPERRHTFGARLNRAASPGRLDFDVEAAAQAGSVADSGVSAWMLGAQLGWSLPGAPLRVYGGLDAASGDHSSGGAVQTFNQLYPLGHAYLGYIDMHGRQNVVALSAGASVKPRPDLTLQLDGFAFRRASADDALYGVEGSAARPAGSGWSRRVGEEIDVTAKRPIAGGRVQLQAGASWYFAGPFLRQSGPAENVSWAYAQASATF